MAQPALCSRNTALRPPTVSPRALTMCAERRHQRLASGSARDKRISYGCVNAPEAFYNQHIAPLFGQGPGVVYVLPDTEPFATFFIAASAYP